MAAPLTDAQRQAEEQRQKWEDFLRQADIRAQRFSALRTKEQELEHSRQTLLKEYRSAASKEQRTQKKSKLATNYTEMLNNRKELVKAAGEQWQDEVKKLKKALKDAKANHQATPTDGTRKAVKDAHKEYVNKIKAQKLIEANYRKITTAKERAERRQAHGAVGNIAYDLRDAAWDGGGTMLSGVASVVGLFSAPVGFCIGALAGLGFGIYRGGQGASKQTGFLGTLSGFYNGFKVGFSESVSYGTQLGWTLSTPDTRLISREHELDIYKPPDGAALGNSILWGGIAFLKGIGGGALALGLDIGTPLLAAPILGFANACMQFAAGVAQVYKNFGGKSENGIRWKIAGGLAACTLGVGWGLARGVVGLVHGAKEAINATAGMFLSSVFPESSNTSEHSYDNVKWDKTPFVKSGERIKAMFKDSSEDIASIVEERPRALPVLPTEVLPPVPPAGGPPGGDIEMVEMPSLAQTPLSSPSPSSSSSSSSSPSPSPSLPSSPESSAPQRERVAGPGDGSPVSPLVSGAGAERSDPRPEAASPSPDGELAAIGEAPHRPSTTPPPPTPIGRRQSLP